jgi:hypothetical protein
MITGEQGGSGRGGEGEGGGAGRLWLPVAAWNGWHRGRGMQATQVCLCSSTFPLMTALMSALIHVISWSCI